MTALVAVDTSLAVPLVMQNHPRHQDLMQWRRGHRLALTAPSLAETYSVLTRLKDDARLAPGDAARLLASAFDEPLTLGPDSQRDAAETLALAGIAGGAVYDGLVALAAREHRAPLATSDQRARGTYERLGVTVLLVPGPTSDQSDIR